MRLINVTFEIEDDDRTEHEFRQYLEYLNPKTIKTLPKTEHLKEDATFKKLVKAKKDLQLDLDRYINNKRE